MFAFIFVSSGAFCIVLLRIRGIVFTTLYYSSSVHLSELFVFFSSSVFLFCSFSSLFFSSLCSLRVCGLVTTLNTLVFASSLIEIRESASAATLAFPLMCSMVKLYSSNSIRIRVSLRKGPSD